MDYYSAIEKNEIFPMCINMDGLGRNYAKCGQREKENTV